MDTPAGSGAAERLKASTQSLGYVILLSTITAISGFLFGYNTAVINGVLLFLRRQFAPSDLDAEIAASAILVGALLGAAAASIIGDRYGRKKSLMFSAVLFTISPLAAAVASTVALFSAARLVGGLAIGLASVLTPVYIAEISPSKHRGALVSLNQLGIVIGILVALLAGWGLSGLGENSWRWMLAVAVVPSLIFFGGLFAIPESPRWLITRGRSTEAMRTLARLVGERAAAEEVQTVTTASAEEQGSWSELFSGDMRKRLAVGMSLALFSQITGVNAVLYYGSVIIREHFPGQSTGMVLASSVIIGTVNLIATLVAMVFLDRWGRRVILMTASGGMAVALACLVVGLNVPSSPPVLMLASIKGVGLETAEMLVVEVLTRHLRDRRAVARYGGLTGSPDESGSRSREKGLARAGNARVRRGMIQLAWRFLMFQKESALAKWFEARTANGPRGVRKTMIVALARKLLIDLWRFVEDGVMPAGVELFDPA